MVEGAVGFHCPECVRANPQPKVKTRRFRPEQRTSLVIIAVNVVVWLAIMATGMQDSFLLDVLALTPEGFCPRGDGWIVLVDQAECAVNGYDWQPGVATGAVWQVITSAFTHVQVWHIMFNMMALLILGHQVEGALGRARFLAIYFFSAIAGSAVVMAFSEPFFSTVGASGAIFGLMGAFLAMTLKSKADLKGILVWLGLNAAFTFLVPNVSWQGHLGGLVGGLAITALMLWLPRKLRKHEWWFVAALAVVPLAAIAVIPLVVY
ncbi:MAG: rhomboid family intramembrane serine protease [Propionibacterium sp.]|nr:rhomboid family intramembrane serine protease [Propionibacterium sp.]